MAITTVLTIGGTAYTAAQRAAARVKPDALTLNLEGQHDVLAFHEVAQGPFPTFDEWATVTATLSGTLRFSGRVVDTQSQYGPTGWVHAYTAYSLRFIADKVVPVEASDGSGTVVFNRPPTDLDYYVATDAGLSVGDMIERVLTVAATATRLNAVGVGAYTSLTPPTLPASTLADLALMTVVPTQPCQFSGNNILSGIDGLISRWMPRFVQRLTPAGVLRYRDTTDAAVFVPQTITLASDFGPGDPVYSIPRVRRSTADCATRTVVRGGPQVEATLLSLVDGTLEEGFSSTDKTNWTLYEFTSPKGGSDYGNITAVTSTSATLQSHDGAVTWATNFWSSHQATVVLIDPAATGVNLYESRTVTSNASLSAGGTSTVHWDASVPIVALAYTQYRITGTSGGLINTWRDYLPREPSTGDTGLLTWVGSRMVTRSSRPVRWANASRSFAEFTAQGSVIGPLGQQFPMVVEAVPSEGLYRFTQPTVVPFGADSKLKLGSPTTTADGLPVDVQIVALYSRGPLVAASPADVSGVPQYAGTAAAFMHVTNYVDVSSWDYYGDTADMAALAEEHAKTTRDVEYDLSLTWDVDSSGAEPGWAYMDFEYALNVAIAGTTSPWSAVNAIPRSVTVRWNTTGSGMPGLHSIDFTASTKRRAFTGDDLYTHPKFATGEMGSTFGGGDTVSGFDPGAGLAGYLAQSAAMMENNPGAGMTFEGLGVDMSEPARWSSTPSQAQQVARDAEKAKQAAGNEAAKPGSEYGKGIQQAASAQKDAEQRRESGDEASAMRQSREAANQSGRDEAANRQAEKDRDRRQAEEERRMKRLSEGGFPGE